MIDNNNKIRTLPLRVVSVLQILFGDRIIVHYAEVLEPGAVDTVLGVNGLHRVVHVHLRAARHQDVPTKKETKDSMNSFFGKVAK